MRAWLNALALSAAVHWSGLVAPVRAADWPMFGRGPTRNAVSPETGAPVDWQFEERDPATDKVLQAGRHIKWSAALGSNCTGSPVVANGLIWIGTNNEHPRDPGRKEDASVLLCFRASDGKFLWQYVSPRLKGTDLREDWTWHGMGSTPLIEGDYLWLLTNRSEVLCLHIGPLLRGEGQPREAWKVDLRQEFKVVPHTPGMAMGFSPSVALYRDWIYVVTGNGVNQNDTVPAPEAPSLICFAKRTGKAVWTDNSPGKNILQSQRSSPLVVEVNGRAQAMVGQGDGWLRSFDAATGKLIWRCDLNRKGTKYSPGNGGDRNYVMATPVYAEGRVYIAPGQDPEHYANEGCLYCIDPTKEGDVSVDLEERPGSVKPNPNSAVVWHTRRGKLAEAEAAKLGRDFVFGRTQSTVVVAAGLAYAAELDGYLHCLDARTGQPYWRHDLKSSVWGSPLWVDGMVYLGDEDGIVWVFPHGKDQPQPRQVDSGNSIHGTPVFANGVLYIPTRSRLYAIQEAKP